MERTPTEIMLEKQLAEMNKKLEIARQIGVTSGFIKMYFDFLKEPGTNSDAFDKANAIYYEFFGEYKYSDIKSFRRVLSYYKNKGML